MVGLNVPVFISLLRELHGGIRCRLLPLTFRVQLSPNFCIPCLTAAFLFPLSSQVLLVLSTTVRSHLSRACLLSSNFDLLCLLEFFCSHQVPSNTTAPFCTFSILPIPPFCQGIFSFFILLLFTFLHTRFHLRLLLSHPVSPGTPGVSAIAPQQC